jgi:hypothetical protein
MPTSAEIAAHKAALAAVTRGHNTFAGAFNAGQSAITPYAADLQPLIHKLNEAAVAHNDSIPLIQSAIAAWDAAVASDPPPIDQPPPIPTSANFHFIGIYNATQGAPAGSSFSFGKHTQWAYCARDGKVRAFGGDGDWRLPDAGFVQQQELNTVLAYDFANSNINVTIETRQWGEPTDGTMPYYHDGCTWVYNSQDDKYYAMPGYQPSYQPNNPNGPDPRGLGAADVGRIHLFDRVTRKWTASTYSSGNGWPGECWGGAYDSTRNRIWIQCAGSNEAGVLRYYDCNTLTFGIVGLPFVPGIERAPGVGFGIVTYRWPQQYNPTTDELICFDGYRGHIIGIRLSDAQPRIIGNVPVIKDGSITTEPVEAVETSITLSVRRQKVFVSTSNPFFLVGGVGGVYVVDIATGTVERAPHPDGLGTSWTEGVYDDTNDCLILAGEIEDKNLSFGLLKYQFDNPVPV